MGVLDSFSGILPKSLKLAEAPSPEMEAPLTNEMRPPTGPGRIRIDARFVEPSTEETLRQEITDLGRNCARQDAWAKLGDLIRTADGERRTTPGGVPVADLLSEGARSDAVGAATRAVRNGDEATATRVLEDLQMVLEEIPEDHGVACVVAMAHVDIGWAWRGEGWRQEISPLHRAAFLHHFRQAAQIIDRFDPFELDAPMLAAVRCALLTAEARPSARVADDYEDLIDLAPGVAKHMRAMGNHLLPRWFGSLDRLDHEARRTMERTADIWGAGAYAWVYFDALSVDPDAYTLLDPTLFTQGLRDILQRQADQHSANLFAAFTGCTLNHDAAPEATRHALTEAFDWIVRDHLREIHPCIWYASKGAWSARLTGEQLSEKGRARALSILSARFAEHVPAGQKLCIGASGVTIQPDG